MGQPKILFVDDQEEIINAFQTLFEEEYQVVRATNGLDALCMIFQEQPSVVVLDIKMGEMDGLAVLEKVRQKKEYDNTKIIIYSGYGDREIKERAFSLGADDFMDKPLIVKELERKINNLSELFYLRSGGMKKSA
ncbi:MAG: response regulator [Halobacteriovoraceae bacterium]|jgi:CheY-like chemotaxis protein|nr:response regulator [Halobacteriovoraceae bacterium]MBT5095612.1 response regulator [Halobacteriovoraceae bacterium]